MNDSAESADAAETASGRAERRWTLVTISIIVLLLAMMVITTTHWAAMPPSRVETVDIKTLHTEGEFVEGNLGTELSNSGKVTVRLIAQQYSFQPQCLVVPADMPVTFRATSTDAIHGFVIGQTNANTMLVPGFVTTFTTTFHKTGELLMPCHEFCGIGHEAMWAHVQIIDRYEFLEKSSKSERLSCVSSK